MARRPTPRPGSSRAWLILPVLGAGVVVGCLGALVKVSGRTCPEARVRHDIHAIALRRGHERGHDDGGFVGPWWIAAGSFDPETGDLVQFRLSSGHMSLAAKRARLIVDPVADTFSFELADAVYTRVPEPGEPGPEHFLIAAERQVLGPVPWGADIVVE